MTIERLMNQPATLHQQTAPADDYDQTPGAATPVTLNVYLEQTAATEAADDAAQQTEWRVFLPAGVEVHGNDTITIAGETYELAGDPWEVWNPRLGRAHHQEAMLRRRPVAV